MPDDEGARRGAVAARALEPAGPPIGAARPADYLPDVRRYSDDGVVSEAPAHDPGRSAARNPTGKTSRA